MANARDWTQLLTQARDAAVHHPHAWEPVYYEGKALIESGRYEEADHQLLLAMDRFPRLTQFAVLYGQSGARGLGREEAVARWETVLPRAPHTPQVVTGLAQAYRAAGQFDAVGPAIEAGLEQMPDNLVLLVYRAEFASQRREWEAAVGYWEAVRVAAPDRIDAVTKPMAALRQLGRFDEAEQLAAAALPAHADDPELAAASAANASAADDWTLAEARWRQVLVLSPANQAGIMGLADALMHQQRPRDADEVVRKALLAAPDNEVLLCEYARLAVRARSWAEAATRWQAVYDQCPPRALTYFEYASALEQAEQYVEAEEMASEGVGFAPDDLALLIKHASLAERRLDFAETAKRWQAIIQRYPDSPAVIEGAARAKKAAEREAAMKKIDAKLPDKPGPKGSLRMIERPAGTHYMPQVGPSALDLLVSGAPIAGGAREAPGAAEPPPTGLAGLRERMRRVFGRS